MYTAISLAQMWARGGMHYGMALSVAIYKITWDYDNWTKEDDNWFWKNLKADNEALKGK